MKVAIVGSRDIGDFVQSHEVYAKIDDKMAELRRLYGDHLVIVSGGARGVDGLAEAVAEAHGVEFELFPAHWRNGDGSYNRAAGFQRNRRVVEAVDKVIAFWDGKSGGTKNTIETAKKLGKAVEVVLI